MNFGAITINCAGRGVACVRLGSAGQKNIYLSEGITFFRCKRLSVLVIFAALPR